MKPVYQSHFHHPPESIGNCFRACIASILEVAIDDIPAFERLPGWNNGEDSDEASNCLKEWLANRDLSLSYHPVYKELIPKGYSILTASSPRIKGGHSVVALDGEIVHDPFSWKTNDRLTDLWDYCVIVPPTTQLVQMYPLRILDHYKCFDGYTFLSEAEYLGHPSSPIFVNA